MALKKTIALFYTCFISLYVFSQNNRALFYIPYAEMTTYAISQQDAFSFIGNQAALAQFNKLNIGAFAERRFLLKENSTYCFAAAMPTQQLGNFGVTVNYAGFSGYNEFSTGLAYAKKLGTKVDMGVRFNYYGYRIPQYGGASTVYFEGGTILHLTDKLNCGLHVNNPLGRKIGKTNESLSAVYKMGMGYEASEHFFIGVDISKENSMPVNVTGGFQYQFNKRFFARMGFRSDIGSAFGGAGISWGKWRLDVATNYHPQLGASPSIMFIYQSQKESTPANAKERN